MSKKRWQKYIEKAKKRYCSIGSVRCPVLGNERVYFTREGFRHLLIKKGKYRSIAEQRRKIELIPLATKTLSSEDAEVNLYEPNREVQLWSVKLLQGNKKVIVIVRQIGSGRKIFLSIMDKDLPGSAQAPQGGLS